MNESDLDDENPTWLKLTKVAGASKSLEVDKNPPDFNNQTDGFKGKHTNIQNRTKIQISLLSKTYLQHSSHRAR